MANGFVKEGEKPTQRCNLALELSRGLLPCDPAPPRPAPLGADPRSKIRGNGGFSEQYLKARVRFRSRLALRAPKLEASYQRIGQSCAMRTAALELCTDHREDALLAKDE